MKMPSLGVGWEEEVELVVKIREKRVAKARKKFSFHMRSDEDGMSAQISKKKGKKKFLYGCRST
jgi:hypothetical protein